MLQNVRRIQTRRRQVKAAEAAQLLAKPATYVVTLMPGNSPDSHIRLRMSCPARVGV